MEKKLKKTFGLVAIGLVKIQRFKDLKFKI